MNHQCAQGDEGCPYLHIASGHRELERLCIVATVVGIGTGIFCRLGIGIFAILVFGGKENAL